MQGLIVLNFRGKNGLFLENSMQNDLPLLYASGPVTYNILMLKMMIQTI